jgi:phosphate acetyltransferase
MELLQQFIEKVKKGPKRIVFPEGTDIRIIAAAAAARDMGIAKPVLLGDPAQVSAAAAQSGMSLDGIEIIAPKTAELLPVFAREYAKARGLKDAIAVNVVRKPLSFGGMMVRGGYADGMVGGVASATASVIGAAALTIGFQENITTPSSFFIMIFPAAGGESERVLIFATADSLPRSGWSRGIARRRFWAWNHVSPFSRSPPRGPRTTRMWKK